MYVSVRRVQHEPHASGPWAGTAPLNSCHAAQQGFGRCVLLPHSTPSDIHRLDPFEAGLGKEENRHFALEGFLGGNPEVRGATGVVE